MRVVVLVVLAALAAPAAGQLNVGPGGVSTPPINLVSVFRFLRNLLVTLFFSDAGDANAETGAGVKESTDITSKFDEKCMENSTDCLVAPPEERQIPNDIEGLDPGQSKVMVLEQQDTSQLLVGKWPLAYTAFIIVTSILIIIISTPYIITGETITRREDAHAGGPDHQDVVLLLSWLLGEASGDLGCLEAAMCRVPHRSARYLAVSAMTRNLAQLLQWWLPTTHSHAELQNHLEHVVESGYAHDCYKYYCPSLPDL